MKKKILTLVFIAIFAISGLAVFTPSENALAMSAPYRNLGNSSNPCQVPVLRVYKDINRGGDYYTFCFPSGKVGVNFTTIYGIYGGSNGSIGLPNDSISSIEVLQPVRVNLFEHCWNSGCANNFSTSQPASEGAVMLFPRGFYNLTDYDFNDKTSGISIYGLDSGWSGEITFTDDINENLGWRSAGSFFGDKSYYNCTNNCPSLVSLKYNKSQTNSFNWNDRMSTIYVPYGKKITVYQDINYRGASKIFTTGVYNLTNYKMSGNITWNDQVSSYKIQ